MKNAGHFLALVLLALLARGHSVGAPAAVETNAAPQLELRFEAEILAFAEADRAKPPIRGGILFVGSSIFRQWTNVAELMAPLPVINRAFGGSRTEDQLLRIDRVVTPYAPRVIVYYCGSNDLKAGDDPRAIFERFRTFSDRVCRAVPELRVVFVSSTRSPDRVQKWDHVDQYNALVRGYCTSAANHTFIDVNPVLFDPNGRPRLELYQADKLHLLPAAYVEFAEVIKPVLTRLWQEVPVPARDHPATKVTNHEGTVE